MTVECPSCQTSFPVDPKKIPEGGVHARCSVCQEVFFVEEPVQADTPVTVAYEPPVAAIGEEEPGEEAPQKAPPAAEGVSTSSREAAEEAAQASEEPAGLDAEFEEEAAFAVNPADADYGFSRADEPASDVSVQEAAEESDLPSEPSSSEEESVWGPPDLDQFAAAEAGMPEERSEEGRAWAEEDATSEAPSPPPFGRRDPTEKAQRLARVLVSDIILYNPDRHRMALEKGNLKVEFEEEIQKSWNEYVEQVGEEVAGGTSYFNDALNEILAKGQQVF